SPVMTARTPGMARAAAVSTWRISPCAHGLLRIRPTSTSANGRSAVYCARPVTFSMPSINGVGRPTAPSGERARASPALSRSTLRSATWVIALGSGGREHRLDDLDVTGAATQIARERLADLAFA